MRDLSNEEKTEIASLKKQLEKLQADSSSQGKTREKLETDINLLNEQVLELQEHVRICWRSVITFLSIFSSRKCQAA